MEIMKLEQHERLRSAESSWIGQVPENWQIRRIKDVFKNFGSGSTPKSSNPVYYEDGTINWLNTTDLNNGYITKTKSKITTIALETLGMRVYPVNSLAIAMYGQGKTRGTVGLFKIATTTNQAACVMYKSFIAHEQFILWWFIHKYADIRAINVGATQPNMNQDFVKFLALALPPIHDQILIANYLNTKTKFIDSSIKIIRSKISNYEKLRKTLINETVCRGLASNATCKPSGVAWLGDIPAHWEIRRLKDVARINEKVLPENTDKEYLFRYIDISSVGNSGLQEEAEWIEFQQAPSRARRIVRKHDVIISTVRTYLKAVAYFDYDPTDVIVSTGFAVLTPTKTVAPGYLAYQVRSDSFVDDVIRASTGVSYPAVNPSAIATLHFLYPPYKEQVEIAAFLDQKTQKIDSIVTNLKAQIETLKELRKTLINEVVTGKLKVTE